MANKLTGQTALVTGGSRGIGRAICLALAAEGADLIIHYHRNRAAAEEVRRLIPGARVIQADLASADSAVSMAEKIGEARLDVLVNNAGVWKDTPLGSTDETALQELLSTNVAGVFRLTQAMLPKLRAGARIVNMSSTAGRNAVVNRSIYGATKAAIDSMTRSWALELAPRGIRVNAVAPGFVETDMTSEFLGDPKNREGISPRLPLGRLSTVDDVAKGALFLCTDDSHNITGQSLNISGGFVI